jgi:1,4-alpha-glucan branching enzyme
MAELKLIKNDPYLRPFEKQIKGRHERVLDKEKELTGGKSLSDFASAHLYYGLHYKDGRWVYTDWLPGADEVWLVGDFSDWQAKEEFRLKRIDNGDFTLSLPDNILSHEALYRLMVKRNGTLLDRIPAYAKRVVRNNETGIFNAQVWHPEKAYRFKHPNPKQKSAPLIYEAHIGMASEEGKVAGYTEFKEKVLPRIIDAGYNTIQLMAIQEHPYYGSFGYHVSSFFAASSVFGTPDELKALIDEAHKHGLRVIMDIVHSHAVKNEVEGLSKYDGTEYQYFHAGTRGMHPAWDSRCFNYGKHEVNHFLLSNCKFWLEEYRFDGFRFDGVTSMLYYDHGLGTDFLGYEQYYNGHQDDDAIVYLTLANKLIHEINPYALSVAEEMSGMPGLASPFEYGGYGFDYRLAMGVPDYWVRLLEKSKDEDWHVGDMFYRLTDKRADEKVVSYAESHDQALVGDKTIIFRLADADMYEHMHLSKINLNIERSIALHKLIRLITAATAGGGYLNFMGNEFGHPEWIDFPREGNNWSYHYARRQWSLADNPELGYHFLLNFDKQMIELLSKNELPKTNRPTLLMQEDYRQLLIFERGGFIFAFNFNPFESFTDYEVPVPDGEYRVVLNTDSPRFLGHDRIDENIFYKAQPKDKSYFIKLYLPTRTALVLDRI